MSVDGPGIFESDTAHDVRSFFRRLLGDGRSSLEATQQILREWQLDEDGEGDPEVWIALAAAQRELGQLLPDVRDRVMAIIASKIDLERWHNEPLLLAKRASVLRALAKKLGTPQGAPRVPKPKRTVPVPAWDPGSVLAYRLPDTSLCLLRVVRIAEFPDARFPVVELLNWNGGTVPQVPGFDALGIMKSTRRRNEKYMLHAKSLAEYERASGRVNLVGHSNDFARSTIECTVQAIGWGQLDQEIVSWFGIGGR